MPNKSHVKGKELEESVYFLQRTILESDPQFRGKPFTIERNQIAISAGVRHEIDLVVKVNPGSDYEASLLFECKNLKKPVAKGVITDFSEKIRALSATRGFVVAEAFSASAKAQAAKDPRVKLVKCSKDFESPLGALQIRHSTTELLDVDVKARVIGASQEPISASIELDEIWSFAGKPTTLRSLIKEYADRLYKEKLKKEKARLVLEGVHEGYAGGRIVFDPGEMTRNEQEIDWMNLSCRFRVTCIQPKIRSKFEMKGYGRTYSFEPIRDVVKGKSLQITVVEQHRDT